MNVAPYSKFIVALMSVVAAVGNMFLELTVNDDTLSSNDWIALVITALVALGVYQVPNKPNTGG